MAICVHTIGCVSGYNLSQFGETNSDSLGAPTVKLYIELHVKRTEVLVARDICGLTLISKLVILSTKCVRCTNK